MRKILFVFVLLVSIGFVAMPANAKTPNLEKNSATSGTLNEQVRTRYVRVRGRRYRVTYRLFRRGGRAYYRIISYRPA